MKTTSRFLLDLSILGIEIWAEGDTLLYEAPKGILTPDLLSQLRDRKTEILNLLQTSTNQIITPISPISREQNSPLSFAQKRLWFFDQLEGKNAIHNIFLALKLEGILSQEALFHALQIIVERHETLRTSFRVINGYPVQIVAPHLVIPLTVVDLSKFAEKEQENQVKKIVKEEVNQPFDLTISPLFRAKLLRRKETFHLLLLTLHHIITDGWSMGILKHELSTLYQDTLEGKSSSLAPLPIQYIDFSHWQRNWLQGKVLEQQINYWKNQLAELPPLLELPTDKPRPPIQTFTGKTKEIQLPSELSQQLKNFSQQSGVTLFMTFLTAFGVLLSRYSHQENIVIGSPVANRRRQEIEPLIGFFVNTLVLKIDLHNNPSFRKLLTRVKEMCLNAYAHQDLPFEKLVEELQPERQLSHHPLFQVMFVLQNIPQTRLDLPDLKVHSLEIERRTAKFDLTLLMRETDQGLREYWEYNTDLFETATIERMTGHFETLLKGILANPEQPIGQLNLLTEAERHQLLVELNDTKMEYPQDKCIHQLFEEQVERTPDAVAVVFEEQQLTYRELNQRANQLAHYLQKLGVGPRVFVGICVERSLDIVVGLLGVLKAGGAYVPLDPAYPDERLTYMISDAQLRILLTQQRLMSQLPEQGVAKICLDQDWSLIGRESQENPLSTVEVENLAYVIYTSGSTGQPKGVLLNHRPLVNLLTWQLKNSCVGLGSKTLQFAPLSFDVSFQEIFATWLAGGTLVLIADDTRKDTVALLQFLNDHQIERLFLPFVALQQFAEIAESRNQYCSSLREIITAGEQLQITPSIANWFSRHPSCTLHNHYGPSETHVVTAYTLTGDPQNWPTLPPIGRSIPNARLFLLDIYGQPVPVGVRAELFIGVDDSVRGYLNRPELTSTRFVPNSFSQNTSARLYRSGDLARYLPDGNIEFLGRIDNQVKIRGFRIELGEIEAVLSQHPFVEQTVIIDRENTSGDKRLVAYLVAQQQQKPTTKELRKFLLEKLPDYMMPSVFVFLDTLPLTPSGKVDRLALPAPEQTRQESEKTFVAPRDELERQLTKIWEAVLAIKGIGIEDNFFELGGHSLLAVRLFAQIEEAFQTNLPLSAIFQAPTVEALAKVLRSEIELPAWYSLVSIQPKGSRPPLFAIHYFGFKDLYHHLEPEQPIYGLRYGMGKPMENVLSLPRMEDLAAHYIEEMRIVQPEGPYFLMGASFGGIVAYEMAQQLVAQGQQVALLAIFDTRIGGSRLNLLPFRQRLSNLWRLGFFEFLKRVKNRIIGKFYRPNPQYSPQIDTQEPLRLVEKAYTPKAYSGRVVLFKAMNPFQIFSVNYSSDWEPPEVGWRKFVDGELEIHEVPGSHTGILDEPNVRVLAEKLKVCIERGITQSEIWDNADFH